jgi:hypothetical protein
MCQPDDMVTNLFHPFEDGLTQRFQDDFQPPYSDFDRHQVMARPNQSEVHTTKHKYFHVETLGKDLQTKKIRFLSLTKDFFSKVVPYPVSFCLGNHRVFFGYLVLSQPSGSSDILSEYEDEPSSMYNSPLQRWIEQSCGYTFKQDEQCNIPDPASLGNVANLMCQPSDLIHWGFLDSFKMQVSTCLVFFECVCR